MPNIPGFYQLHSNRSQDVSTNPPSISAIEKEESEVELVKEGIKADDAEA